MSSHALRLTILHHEVDQAIDTELAKRQPNPLRLFRLRRLKQMVKQRFVRLFRRNLSVEALAA